jgi:hypothetical protein
MKPSGLSALAGRTNKTERSQLRLAKIPNDAVKGLVHFFRREENFSQSHQAVFGRSYQALNPHSFQRYHQGICILFTMRILRRFRSTIFGESVGEIGFLPRYVLL